MINNKKKISPEDIVLMSAFLSKYNKLELFSSISDVLDLLTESVQITYVEPKDALLFTQQQLVYDVLELSTAIRVRIYPKQLMKICRLIDPRIDDNYVSKTLYQIKIKHPDKFQEKIQGKLLVWSRTDKQYTNTKKPVEGDFSRNCDPNTHKSNLVQVGNERVVFLTPLEKNAERQTKVYLATKYHPETWVVSFKNNQKDVWLFNWQESTDHIRTYYSRENGHKNDDIRCRRLKNYCKVK
jgi:hypothetical protein